jgi:hypothetical protein
VQKNGSPSHAPATTDGQQTAFILNAGTINQAIEFKKGGDYELSFKPAAQAGPTPSPAQPVAGTGRRPSSKRSFSRRLSASYPKPY